MQAVQAQVAGRGVPTNVMKLDLTNYKPSSLQRGLTLLSAGHMLLKPSSRARG